MNLHYRLWLGAFFGLVCTLALLASCAKTGGPDAGSGAKGTPREAEKFIGDAEKRLFDLNVKYSSR